MAPEQFAGESATAKSDVYNFAMTIIEVRAIYTTAFRKLIKQIRICPLRL